MPVDESDDSESTAALLTPDRRNMLRYLGIAGVGGLAGCGGDGGGDTTTTDTTTTETTTTTTTETTTTTTTTEQRQVSGNFRRAFSSSATTLNWIFNTEAGTGARIGTTMDGTWAINNKDTTGTLDDEVFPLWLDVESQDNKTYTMTVQDGLQWGGTYGQMTADDWVYMLDNLMLAEENWAGYPNYGAFTGEVSKTGPMEFEYTLQSKDVVWQYRPPYGGGMWGLYCVPKALLQQYVQMWQDGDTEGAAKGLEQDQELTNLTYTGNLGPYNISAWEQEARFEATRNENYYMQEREGVSEAWQGAPYFEKTIHRVVPEQASRLQALSNGEIDRAALPPNRVQEFKNDESIDVYSINDPYLRVMIFNMRANGWLPFRDKKVRQAVMTAMKKSTFVQDVFRGYAAPAHTMQPNWSSWYDDSKVTKFGVEDTFGIEKARSRLSNAFQNGNYDHGYSVDGQTVVNESGDQATLTLIAQSGQPTEQTMAQLIKQYLEQVGFKISIKSVPGLTFVQNYAMNSVPEDKVDQMPDDWPYPNPTQPGFNSGPRDLATSKKAWDIALIYRFNSSPRTPSASKTFFYEQGGANFYGYKASEGVNIKSMYEEAAAASDPETRQQLFAEAFGAVSREQPFGILMSEQDTQGFQGDIVGPQEEYGQGWDGLTWYRRS